MDNIRYVIIGRVSDQKLLLQYLPDKKNKSQSDDVIQNFYFKK